MNISSNNNTNNITESIRPATNSNSNNNNNNIAINFIQSNISSNSDLLSLNEILNNASQVNSALSNVLNNNNNNISGNQSMFRNINNSNNCSRGGHGHSHDGINTNTNSNSHQVVLELNQMVTGMNGNRDGGGSSSQEVLSAGPSDQQPQPQQQQQQLQLSQEQSQLNQHQQEETNGNNNGLFGLALQTLQSSLPFFLILIAKIFHQHLIGFFIVLGFITTLHWSNRTLVNQVQLKEKKQNHKLALLILFLVSNVFIFFYIFKESNLENCLIFMSSSVTKMDTWNLVWIVVCSDTIVKFLVISFKALVTLLPFSVIALRRRGSVYAAIEHSALFYRSLTPIHPWLLFLTFNTAPTISSTTTNTNTSRDTEILAMALNENNISNSSSSSESSGAFAIFLCILYIVFKINHMYNGLPELLHSIQQLLLDTSYGSPISLNENEENICPICQDSYKSPVILKCKHTFCQDCVCVWLDKENSCPMCRSRVGSVKKPKFKDGSTTILVQWF